ncbi:transposase [Streptomyces litmocidini]|uniref:transposase n=1 Tax=Streptomyces litmocidini TaxID=67318 RepID=UPI0033C61645
MAAHRRRPESRSACSEPGRPRHRDPLPPHRRRRSQRLTRAPPRRAPEKTLAALKSIRAARPDGAPIYVIMDDLSAHKGAGIRRWVRKSKVELCFTSTYASWANPIEAHFGPLRQFTIANSNHPNHSVQTRALHVCLSWRNANARHRDVLAAECKERARIRSEKGIRWGGRPISAA